MSSWPKFKLSPLFCYLALPQPLLSPGHVPPMLQQAPPSPGSPHRCPAHSHGPPANAHTATPTASAATLSLHTWAQVTTHTCPGLPDNWVTSEAWPQLYDTSLRFPKQEEPREHPTRMSRMGAELAELLTNTQNEPCAFSCGPEEASSACHQKYTKAWTCR